MPDYVGALADISDHITNLAVYTARWAQREHGEPDADGRRAANHALDTIDAVLRLLHNLRAVLINDVRVSDEEFNRRVDEMLGITWDERRGR